MSSISESSHGAVLVSDHVHDSTATATTESSLSSADASHAKTITDIHDLADSVLVEILCRLPSYKYTARCKLVSKSWCALMSDHSFIGRFLRLQSDGKQMPVVQTLINNNGWEFLARLSSSRNPLARLFEMLMAVHHLEEEPTVVGTYNDLVLCCASLTYQRDYYICNPHTRQWVTIPRPPQLFEYTPVGFICDLPYFQCLEENHEQKGQLIQINPQYRCRVVRLILDFEKMLMGKIKVQIFASETGEWMESTLSIPSPITMKHMGISASDACYPYNGVVYWKGPNFLIGVDPFMMITTRNNTSLPTSSSSIPADDHYKCHFIEFDQFDDDMIYLKCLGVDRGCLQMGTSDYAAHVFSVWEWNEDVSVDADKYCLQQKMRVYELDRDSWDAGYDFKFLLAFDPSNDGTLYMHIGRDTTVGEILMYNNYTGEWSKILEDSSFFCSNFRPLALQCWPTPVPNLPPHTSLVKSPTSFVARRI